jgi:hypothetical protein
MISKKYSDSAYWDVMCDRCGYKIKADGDLGIKAVGNRLRKMQWFAHVDGRVICRKCLERGKKAPFNH